MYIFCFVFYICLVIFIFFSICFFFFFFFFSSRRRHTRSLRDWSSDVCSSDLGSMRVIDIQDPQHPKEVARWQTEQTEAGRYLHDIMVVDGLAYLAYWNDGLVILDVGNGMRGGSPTNPQFVSQYKYDLTATYARVWQLFGQGFVRGTHTAWRQGRY